ncbi:MAG: ORF6N domain-containing protein [Candidatus Binatia bacterium]
MANILSSERIERSILLIRSHKVMLDADLAVLYGVSVGRLNEAVKRNRDRFPDDFMFQLSAAEFHKLKLQIGDPNSKSQIAISSSDWGGRRQKRVNVSFQRQRPLASARPHGFNGVRR